MQRIWNFLESAENRERVMDWASYGIYGMGVYMAVVFAIMFLRK